MVLLWYSKDSKDSKGIAVFHFAFPRLFGRSGPQPWCYSMQVACDET
jgi:hypothetical protein